jgi:D-methionine transport system substrate-binding protein
MTSSNNSDPTAWKLSRRHVLLAGAALGAAGRPADAQERPLKVALATSISNQAAEIAVREARAQGLDVELVEFSDWNTPNRVAAEKEADANLFQHVPFLEFTNQQTGFGLVPVAIAFSTPFGLYSKKTKALADLPANPRIAISGDAVNTGRALLLLRQAGYLRLKDGADHRVKLTDIAEYRKPVRIIQLDGPQIARALDDVDAAATYPTFARLAGLDASAGLLFENDPIYAFRFVTRPDFSEDARLKRFIAIYQNSEAVKAKLRELYGSLVSFPR